MQLSRRVGRDIAVGEADTTAIKAGLQRLGFYEEPSYGMTPYPDDRMFEGLKALQARMGLEATGTIRPGGPEEAALSNALADAASGGTVHVREHSRDGHPVSAYDRAAPGGGEGKQRMALNWVERQFVPENLRSRIKDTLGRLTGGSLSPGEIEDVYATIERNVTVDEAKAFTGIDPNRRPMVLSERQCNLLKDHVSRLEPNLRDKAAKALDAAMESRAILCP
jgi:hypothetical protein